jgi:hypothetical protein
LSPSERRRLPKEEREINKCVSYQKAGEGEDGECDDEFNEPHPRSLVIRLR